MSQTAKPARRRLQKCDPKLKGLRSKRGSADSNISLNYNNNYNVGYTSPTARAFEELLASNVHSPTRLAHSPGLVHSPGLKSPSFRQLPDTPDLSDSKWNHYLDSDPSSTSPSAVPEGDLKTVSKRPSQEQQQPQQRVIPEFSHLKIQAPPPRPSLDNSSIPSPASSTSTSSAMRRQAKTPVFRIGQLEKPVFGRDIEGPEKTSSVELIAEQYRALLETRDASDIDSIYSNPQFERRPSHDGLDVPQPYTQRHSSESTRSNTLLQPPRPSTRSKQPTHPPSPENDDGLIAYKEDAIYFKPISFDPAPTPPLDPRQSYPTPRVSTTDNISLQICIDLLTRELSSAFANHPRQNGPDTTALQVWVMIEAYERLRDRMAAQNPEMRKVFGCWLSALYSLHSSLTAGTPPSESEYSGLEEDVD